MTEHTVPNNISSDYLMGCMNALTILLAMVAKKLPPDQQESIVDIVAKTHIAIEARWEDVYPDDSGPRVREIGLSDTYGLFLSKVLD